MTRKWWIVLVCLLTAVSGFAQAGRFRSRLLASDGDADDLFGNAVDVDGDWAVIGAPKPGDEAGAAYFWRWNGTNWVEEDVVAPSDSALFDQFGEAVAISGDSAIIGATHPMLFSAGKAYVFTRSGMAWSEQDDLTGGGDSTLFGESVDISGDYAIVGDRLGTNPAGVAVGTAHVFKRSGSSWALDAKLFASDGVADDWFGRDVAIDGEYAIVGANARSNFVGGAYLFKRNGTVWSEVSLLNNPDDTLNDMFGLSVDLDDGWAIVGTRHDAFQGAYLYRLDGVSWVLHAGLPDIYGRADVYGYGEDVTLRDPYAVVGGGEHAILWKRAGTNWIKQVYMGGSADDWNLSGTSLAVHWRNVLSGHASDNTLGNDAGAAWVLPVHDRNRQSELIPTNNGLHYFGSGVAVDGDWALVGAEEGSVAQGFGYCGVFARTGQYWLARAQLVPSDAGYNMQFGSSVALAGDYALVGAGNATNPGGYEVGAAYVFWFDGTNWVQQAKLTDANDEEAQWMGRSVETDGRWALVGTPAFDWDEGKVLTYLRDGTNWTAGEVLPNPILDTGRFGWDIGFDGTRAVFGSPLEYEGGHMDAGAAYVYLLTGTNWTYETRLASATPSFFAHVGWAVDIDDDWAVCGAPTENAPTNQCGAIYLYRRSGTTWSQALRIPAPEFFTNGYFGSSVAIRKPYVLACANGTEARRAYLYQQDGTNWNLLTRLYPADGDPNESFGSSCDLSEDHAVVGLDVQDGRKAYLFWREAWDQQPAIGSIRFEDGLLRLSLTNLFGPTCVVQRASSLIEPIDWSNLVEINKPFLGTNDTIVVPTNLVEYIRVLSDPGRVEDQ